MELNRSKSINNENKDELKRIVSEAKLSGISINDFEKMIEEMWGK